MAAYHPGRILYERYLQPRSLSQNRLARAIEVPPRRINEIILGKRSITADTAVRLARYFGNDPADWMKLQTDYDIALATNNIGIHLYAMPQHEADAGADTVADRHEAPKKPGSGAKKRGTIKHRLLR